MSGIECETRSNSRHTPPPHKQTLSEATNPTSDPPRAAGTLRVFPRKKQCTPLYYHHPLSHPTSTREQTIPRPALHLAHASATELEPEPEPAPAALFETTGSTSPHPPCISEAAALLSPLHDAIDRGLSTRNGKENRRRHGPRGRRRQGRAVARAAAATVGRRSAVAAAGG